MKSIIHPAQYRAIRKELQLTQPQLAELLGVAVSTISRRENGKDPITRETSMALEGFYKLETGSFRLPKVPTLEEEREDEIHLQECVQSGRETLAGFGITV